LKIILFSVLDSICEFKSSAIKNKDNLK